MFPSDLITLESDFPSATPTERVRSHVVLLHQADAASLLPLLAFSDPHYACIHCTRLDVGTQHLTQHRAADNVIRLQDNSGGGEGGVGEECLHFGRFQL